MLRTPAGPPSSHPTPLPPSLLRNHAALVTPLRHHRPQVLGTEELFSYLTKYDLELDAHFDSECVCVCLVFVTFMCAALVA